MHTYKPLSTVPGMSSTLGEEQPFSVLDPKSSRTAGVLLTGAGGPGTRLSLALFSHTEGFPSDSLTISRDVTFLGESRLKHLQQIVHEAGDPQADGRHLPPKHAGIAQGGDTKQQSSACFPSERRTT